jgi:hypothetical protein
LVYLRASPETGFEASLTVLEEIEIGFSPMPRGAVNLTRPIPFIWLIRYYRGGERKKEGGRGEKGWTPE